MKKINNDLFYKRIEKYAYKGYKGRITKTFSYKVIGEDESRSWLGKCKVVELTNVCEVEGHEFNLFCEIYVPYDGRKNPEWKKDVA